MTSELTLQERIDEVAIGLAGPELAAEIEQLATADPGIARMLDRTRARFGELDATAAPQNLPADMWDRVAARLEDAQAAPDADHAPSDVAPQSGGVVTIRRPAASRALVWTTFTSLAASLILAVVLGWSVMSRPDPIVIAVLVNDGGEPVALIEGAEDNTTRITLLGAASVPSGRIMQVWTKPDADGPPVSLGLLARPEGARLTIQGLPVPASDQLYEITFEQDGGSPTGLPTGPIYGKGLARLPH